jgi:hypothetical protein
MASLWKPALMKPSGKWHSGLEQHFRIYATATNMATGLMETVGFAWWKSLASVYWLRHVIARPRLA